MFHDVCSVNKTSEVDDSALALATPTDIVECKVIDTLYGSSSFPFPFARATATGVRQGIASSMDKNDWNDYNWIEQIVNEELHPDIAFNEIEEAIEQGNKEDRTCT